MAKDKVIILFICCYLFFVAAAWYLLLLPCTYRHLVHPEYYTQLYWIIDITGFMATLLSTISVIFYLGYFLNTDVPEKNFLKYGTAIGFVGWILGIGNEIVLIGHISLNYIYFDMYLPVLMLVSFVGQGVFGVLMVYRRKV